MNSTVRFLRLPLGLMTVLLVAFLFSGCAHKIDWNARVGNYTFDQAVLELGPPDKQQKLEDKTLVAEWLTRHGYSNTSYPGYYGGYRGYYGAPVVPVETYSPDYFLRLTFSPDGKLSTWKDFAK